MDLPQILRQVLAFIPGRTIYDPAGAASLGIDEADHVCLEILHLWSHLIVQVRPIKRLTEDGAALYTQRANDVVLHFVLRCGGKSHDRYAWVLISELAELEVWSHVSDDLCGPYESLQSERNYNPFQLIL